MTGFKNFVDGKYTPNKTMYPTNLSFVGVTIIFEGCIEK